MRTSDGFLVKTSTKTEKNPCCYVFVSLLQLSRCTNALCSSTLSFPRCGASCGNGESRHPSGGNMHGIYRVHGAPPLLPALLQVLLPAPKCQKLQTYLLKWWSSKRLVDVFLPWDGGEKNKCIQFQYCRQLQASRTSFKESWVSKPCPKVEHNDGTLMINRLACSSISINSAIYLQAKWLQSVGGVKMHNIELLEGTLVIYCPLQSTFKGTGNYDMESHSVWPSKALMLEARPGHIERIKHGTKLRTALVVTTHGQLRSYWKMVSSTFFAVQEKGKHTCIKCLQMYCF